MQIIVPTTFWDAKTTIFDNGLTQWDVIIEEIMSTLIQESVIEDSTEPGQDFTVNGNFFVVVKQGKIILEVKVGNDYYGLGQPTDQYYRNLIITENSMVTFSPPEAGTVCRLRPVKGIESTASAYSIDVTPQ